ncbi:MAG: M20/M25/M40 family metallo-hydrolase [Bacteroidetes bacterium]|nr:M20/M25/M40 family metallo-hydrolase [Bacteroidota bacterium]
MKLLKRLCSIHAPSGNEGAMTAFLLEYIHQHQANWNTQPRIYSGNDFQNCIILVFGEPRTAVYAHMDNIGFTVRYNNQLVKIGSPHFESGVSLVGSDANGKTECTITIDDENRIFYKATREIERGTDLSYKPEWREDENFVQCCYLDNRLGVWNALKLCESLKDGAVVFSCWEEHGGGSVPYLSRFLFEKYNIRRSLISDITWITEGVVHGEGVVISMRDSGIPRRIFIDKIISLAKESHIPFQLEVEASGGSDGTELQKQPYPIDWCFIGAAEDFVHSPDEKVHKKDIENMVNMYRYLMEHL